MSKFKRLSKLCTEINELEARVRTAAQEEFKPALKEVISIIREEVPQIKQLKWAQWIPGFNDGDACEFTMGEVYFSLRSKDLKDSGENEDGFFESSYDEERAMEHKKNPNAESYCYGITELVVSTDLTHNQASLISELGDTISGLSAAAELAFGLDVEVTLDIDTGELTMEEYDCGY